MSPARLGQPSKNWRAAAQKKTSDQEVLGALTRCKVLAALRAAGAPLSIQATAAAAGISYYRAQRALASLVAMKCVVIVGRGNNRPFALADTGGGEAA